MTSSNKPPVTGERHPLSFQVLSPGSFERMCLWLVEREGFDRIEHLGQAGGEQGRDLMALRDGMRYAFQCKRVVRFGPKDADLELDKILALEKAQRPEVVVFLVTSAVSVKTRNRAAGRCRQSGIGCEFWAGTELDARVKNHADIVAEFFQVESLAHMSPRRVTWGIPPLPPGYLPRADVDELIERVLREDARAIGITADQRRSARRAEGVLGMGGVGKSVLAAALAHDDRVQDAFPHGVIWLTVGREADIVARQAELLKALGLERLNAQNWVEGRARLSELTRESRSLVILDDVWEEHHAEAFSRLGSGCRLIVTTRDRAVLERIGASNYRVDVLSPEAALELLARLARGDAASTAELPLAARDVARECGYLPLALAVSAALIRGGRYDWGQLLAQLEGQRVDRLRARIPDYEHEGIVAALKVSLDALPQVARSCFVDCAVFHEDARIPEVTLVLLWESRCLDEDEALDTLQILVDRSLMTRDDERRCWIHDLYHDYLQVIVEDASSLHERLVAAYEAQCRGRWADGPDDGYFFENLVGHLHGAGRSEELGDLLLDFSWLSAKLRCSGTASLLADFGVVPPTGAVALVQNALRLSIQVLSRDPEQLAPQLHARLHAWIGSSEVAKLLADGATTFRESHLEYTSGTMAGAGGAIQQTLVGHSDEIRRVFIFERKGVTLAVTVSKDRTARIWDVGSGVLRHVLEGHRERIVSAVVTPDCHYLATGSADGVIKLWDTDTGVQIHSICAHDGVVFALETTPGGDELVSCSGADFGFEELARECTVKLWRLDCGRELYRFDGHRGAVRALAVDGSGRLAASCGTDGTCRVWDLKSGGAVRVFEHDGCPVRCAVWLSGNDRIATADQDGILRMFSVRDDRLVWRVQAHRSQVNVLLVGKDRRTLLTASGYSQAGTDFGFVPRDGEWKTVAGDIPYRVFTGSGPAESGESTIRAWDAETGRELRVLDGHEECVRDFAVVADGRLLVSASEDGSARTWRLEDAVHTGSLVGHVGSVNAVAVSPRGDLAVTGSDDCTAKVWSLRRFAEPRPCDPLAGSIGAASASRLSASYPAWRVRGAHQRTVALAVRSSGRGDSDVSVHDTHSGETLRYLEKAHHVRDLVLTADDRSVITGHYDGALRMWDLQAGRTEWSIEDAHADEITAVGRIGESRIITTSLDGTVRLWTFAGECLVTLEDHMDQVHGLAVVDAVGAFVTASADGTVRAYDADGRPGSVLLDDQADAVTGLVAGRRGAVVVAASVGTGLLGWHIPSGDRCLELPVFGVQSIAITPEGSTVLVGFDDLAELLVYGLESGPRCVRVSSPVGALGVSGDGVLAAVGGIDGSVQILDIATLQVMGVFTLDAAVTCIDFAGSDGVIAGSRDGFVHLFRWAHSRGSTSSK